jgi:hypothetical protein
MTQECSILPFVYLAFLLFLEYLTDALMPDIVASQISILEFPIIVLNRVFHLFPICFVVSAPVSTAQVRIGL